MPNYTNSIWSGTPPVHPHGERLGDLEVDVAIIGADITGVTAAYLLKASGLRVALLESGQVGEGETGKTSRFDPLGRVLNGPATASLERKSLPAELLEKGGIHLI